MRGRPVVAIKYHHSMCVQLKDYGHNVHLSTAYIWYCSTGLKKWCVTAVVKSLFATFAYASRDELT